MSLSRREALTALGLGLACSKRGRAETGEFDEVEFTNRRPSLEEFVCIDDGSRVGGDLSQVRVVHVWSDFCPPCIHELPVWAKIYDRLAIHSGIRFIFVAETYGIDRARRFIQSHRAIVPRVQQYYLPLDDQYGSFFRKGVGASIQPITILLDRRSVIRQGFSGSINSRIGELEDAWARLFCALSNQHVSLETQLEKLSRRQDTWWQFPTSVESWLLHCRVEVGHKGAGIVLYYNKQNPNDADLKWVQAICRQDKYRHLNLQAKAWSHTLTILFLHDNYGIIRSAFCGPIWRRAVKVVPAMERLILLY